MFPRILKPPVQKSFFLFGPRGTGKTLWTRQRLADAVYLDLLDSGIANELLAEPARLERRVPPGHRGWVVIDEIQKIPALLDEVHRLIEGRRLHFALTGSSARKLKRQDVNLLAGRALTLRMHPLTCEELGDAFSLRHSLSCGHLPAVHSEKDPAAFLKSYVQTYLREEVQQEGLVRNLGSFARFLEAASFSQASPLNVAAVARDCHVERKAVEDWFSILEDLMLAVRVPVFARRAKRSMTVHPKFYFFDTGVFRALRPRGPLDVPEEIDGAAMETLVFQEIRALNDYHDLGYTLHHWRSTLKLEVDLVLYGERGIRAIEVKRSARIRQEDYKGLMAFIEDYPMAKGFLVTGGTRAYTEGPVQVLPIGDFLTQLPHFLA